MKQIKFKIFRSDHRSWEKLFQDAADFASGLTPEELITVTVTSAGGTVWGGVGAEGLVTVWYRA